MSNRYKKLVLPAGKKEIGMLRQGEICLVSGVMWTARDATLRNLTDCWKKQRRLPVSLKGQAIYYTGPCPAPPGMAIGPCGPTSSCRMERYLPFLLEQGVNVTIGKGKYSENAVKLARRWQSLYLIPVAGPAWLATRVVQAEVIAFPELGPEAMRKLVIKEFPSYVMIGGMSR